MKRHTTAVVLATLLTAAGLGFAQDFVTFKDQPSQDLFVASRAALARGDGSVKNLQSLILKGHARIAQDDGSQAESAVVIKVLLPDSYLRVDTFPATVQATGFQGNHLLTSITEAGRTSTPPPAMTDALLKSERARVTRLLLGSATALMPALRLIGRTAPGIGSMERPSATTTGATTYDSANELRLIEFSGPGRVLYAVRRRLGADPAAAGVPRRQGRDLDDDVQRAARGQWSPPAVSHRDDGPRRRARGSEAGRDPRQPAAVEGRLRQPEAVGRVFRPASASEDPAYWSLRTLPRSTRAALNAGRTLTSNASVRISDATATSVSGSSGVI